MSVEVLCLHGWDAGKEVDWVKCQTRLDEWHCDVSSDSTTIGVPLAALWATRSRRQGMARTSWLGKIPNWIGWMESRTRVATSAGFSCGSTTSLGCLFGAYVSVNGCQGDCGVGDETGGGTDKRIGSACLGAQFGRQFPSLSSCES